MDRFLGLYIFNLLILNARLPDAVSKWEFVRFYPNRHFKLVLLLINLIVF